MDIKIRTATVEDAEQLLEIYAYYVKNTFNNSMEGDFNEN